MFVSDSGGAIQGELSLWPLRIPGRSRLRAGTAEAGAHACRYPPTDLAPRARGWALATDVDPEKFAVPRGHEGSGAAEVVDDPPIESRVVRRSMENEPGPGTRHVDTVARPEAVLADIDAILFDGRREGEVVVEPRLLPSARRLI